MIINCLFSDHIYILKTIRWNMHLEIAVLGQRARLLGSGESSVLILG